MLFSKIFQLIGFQILKRNLTITRYSIVCEHNKNILSLFHTSLLEQANLFTISSVEYND